MEVNIYTLKPICSLVLLAREIFTVSVMMWQCCLEVECHDFDKMLLKIKKLNVFLCYNTDKTPVRCKIANDNIHVYAYFIHFHFPVLNHCNLLKASIGGRVNIDMPSYQYWNFHDKNMVSLLSCLYNLEWRYLYWNRTLNILHKYTLTYSNIQ